MAILHFGILILFWRKNNLHHKNAVFCFYLRVSRMVEGGTEIFCDLDQKNLKRKSYKQARVSLKSVLNSEYNEEYHINSVEFQLN